MLLEAQQKYLVETRLLIDTHEYNTPYKIEKDAEQRFGKFLMN